MTLDMDFVRSQFPALDGGWAYFDNAGGSQVLRGVADRVSDYLLTTSVQTGASYEPSQRASERLAEARSRIALFVNAARSEEVVFGPSTSVLVRFLATAMASQFKPGDEVVVTDFDHESNIGPWLALKERGVIIRTWTLDRETLAPDLADLAQLMNSQTRLVCVTHASNLLGSINPVREIAELVHAHGARICIDGVAYAPHRAIDVQALGVDYYVFSCYKTYGPHYAVMYGRYEHLLELDGLYHYFYGKEKVPSKLEPGNACYELVWGAAGIVDYFEKLGGGEGRTAIEQAFEIITAHEAAIGGHLLSWLRSRNDVRIVGQRSAEASLRVPTISFIVEGQQADQIVRAVDNGKVGIRYGDFHSRRLAEALDLGPAGVLRVSMVHYNTIAEVDRLITALEKSL
ncbi:cysteine desulfurase-like protein [Mesorhizobium sp. CN2-181]|uniref:cysteine desulfurase-like protein n=1 Tax=Mesorhizobium yinganensis TaxID=3157707 RepID=UPI0032B84908